MKLLWLITLAGLFVAPAMAEAGDGHRIDSVLKVPARPRQTIRRRLNSKSSSSKTSKKSRSCKDSKKGDRSSKKNSDACLDNEDIEEIACEDLRDLVFELTTRIRDLGAETLRFSILTDQLEQTAQIAETGDVSRRKLTEHSEEETEYRGQLQESLQELDHQRELLATGNGRVTQLNAMLLQSTLGWIGLNGSLTGLNGVLTESIHSLTQDNLNLLAQRDELTIQVQDLNSQLDKLFEMLDGQGESNGTDLEYQIERLTAENAEYERVNKELQARIDELVAQNGDLAEQNEIFAGINQDLNATTLELEGQIDRLEGEVDDLTNQTSYLESVVDDLQNETTTLQDTNGQLEDLIEKLETEVDRLENKTEEFSNLNNGLSTIASFLNETAGEFDENYEDLTVHLAEQIEAYRAVAVETLHNTYIQRVSLWDCAYREHFGDHDFASDGGLEIPDDMFGEVMDYINERVLKELCLTKNDFDHYLSEYFDDPIFTSNHFVSGINAYSLLALNYYFPDSGEVGLSAEDWSIAGFSCERLPNDKKYLFKT